ncbi:MAG: hypothetical protein Greene041679_314, partial [Parcubacteria group bacterium Greene0416_79]
GQFSWVLVYLGAIAGLAEKRHRSTVLFLLTLIVFHAVLIGYNGLISSGGRYNMPFLPLWFLLGSYGWIRIGQFFSRPYNNTTL